MDSQGLLLDTNIFLEILLGQGKSFLAQKILNLEIELFVTSFSLQSVYVICRRYELDVDLLELFMKKLQSDLSGKIELKENDLLPIYELSITNQLDFDDAHIYFYAKKNNLKLVSFDEYLQKLPDVFVNPFELI